MPAARPELAHLSPSERKSFFARRWYHANRARALATGQVWRANNRSRMRVLYRRHDLWKKYKITPIDWEAMFAAQGRRCAVCRSDHPGSKIGWVTDHCHKLNRVRGILCAPCNMALGQAKDSPSTLRALAAYLEQEVQHVLVQTR